MKCLHVSNNYNFKIPNAYCQSPIICILSLRHNPMPCTLNYANTLWTFANKPVICQTHTLTKTHTHQQIVSTYAHSYQHVFSNTRLTYANCIKTLATIIISLAPPLSRASFTTVFH